jgi:hypothetical protein
MVALAPDLFQAPDQVELLRRLSLPAETGPLPLDAGFQADVVVVPAADAGRPRPVLFSRADAIALVEIEREIIRRGGPEAQALEYERCRRDRLWFIARWVSLETKFKIPGADRTVPFTPYPYQVRGIRLYDRARIEGKWIFQDKSRQMGESWLLMALILHGVVFEDQFSALVTHRKEVEVDDGGAGSTTKSLLGRLRFMYESLPPFLRLAPGTDSGALEIKHLLVRNEGRGSYVVGEGSSPNIGRGASFRVWLGDEWAHTEQSESAAASVNEAVDVGILNSTPQGEGNHFARTKNILAKPRSASEEQLRERYLVNRVHWSEHPQYSIGIERDAEGRLTSPWYRRACANLTDDLAAQEYDINYARSLPGRYLPEFAYGRHVPEEPIELHTGLWFYLSADHGLADTEIWGLWQTDGESLAELVDEWHTVPPGQKTGSDLTSREVADGVLDWLGKWGLTLNRLQGVFPDPSGGARDQTSGQSHHQLVQDQWAKRGQRLLDGAWVPANNEFAQGIMSTRLLLKGTYAGRPFDLRISPRCTLTIDSLQNYRRVVTRDGSVTDRELHDWSSHAAAMIRYFSHTLFPAIGDIPAAEREGESYTSANRGRI